MRNYDIWWLLQPTHLLLWFTCIGALLLALFPRRRWRRLRVGLIASSITLLIAAYLPLGLWLIAPLEQRFASPAANTPPPTGIIVLAGSEQVALTARYDDPHLSGSADRLTTFVRLAQRFPEAQLIHAGRGNREAGLDQSLVARRLFEAALPGRAILYEDQSTDTHTGATEVARLIDGREEERWWLVTSAFHMPRSVAAFRAAGLVNVVAYPTDYYGGPSGGWTRTEASRRLEVLDWAAHEWLGLLWYRAHGYTSELFPAPTRRPAREEKGREALDRIEGQP